MPVNSLPTPLLLSSAAAAVLSVLCLDLRLAIASCILLSLAAMALAAALDNNFR